MATRFAVYPLSAFQVFDNKKKQRIASFEEHAGTSAVPLPGSSYGVFSNDYLLHLPSVLNVIVIDIANIRIADQESAAELPAHRSLEQPAFGPTYGDLPACRVRVFFGTEFHHGSRSLIGCPAPGHSSYSAPGDREYLSDQQILSEVAYTLRSLPGRKNVPWFSGGSTAYLLPNGTAFQDQVAMRAIYDSLEEERIAVYPIDARGLTVASGIAMIQQHGQMENVARATGGHAFYDNNGVALAAAHVLDTSGSFYTLTYAPSSFHVDNKWHNVRIKLDGGYHLSYRTGYFADGNNGAAQKTASPRTKLLTGGDTVQTRTQRATPIIFQAAMLPTADPILASLSTDAEGLPAPPPKGGARRFTVRYSV